MKITALGFFLLLPATLFAQTSTFGNANGLLGDPDLFCSQPGNNRGAVRCIEPKCKPGEVKKRGQCVPAPIRCTAPAIPKNGKCVKPPLPAADPAPFGRASIGDPDLFCSQLQNQRGAVRCIEPTCRPGEVKKKGKCVVPAPICIAPAVLKNGKCVTPQPANTEPTRVRVGVPCGLPNGINECMPDRGGRCLNGESFVNGKCQRTPIPCTAPSILRDGRCVAPGGSADGGNNGGADGTAPGGRDAKHCLVIGMKSANDPRNATKTITNRCNEKIGLHFCHGPSSRSGSRNTECGERGRYFQQFTTLNPGQTNANYYSMPGDATLIYGACFGGEGRIKQTGNGDYICR